MSVWAIVALSVIGYFAAGILQAMFVPQRKLPLIPEGEFNFHKFDLYMLLLAWPLYWILYVFMVIYYLPFTIMAFRTRRASRRWPRK